jgi:hypothetical protein
LLPIAIDKAFFAFAWQPAVEDKSVVCGIGFGDLRGHEIPVHSSKEFFPGVAHQFAHRLVQGDKAMSVILGKHRLGHDVDELAQKRDGIECRIIGFLLGRRMHFARVGVAPYPSFGSPQYRSTFSGGLGIWVNLRANR